MGLVSFFADISTEMVYPIIPLYLTSVFGATPALVGIIEGLAESISSLLKVYSGYITDRYQRKKPLAFLGYSAGVLYKLALIMANSWTGILGARVVDRIGKGIRTSPRDVMVSESAGADNAGLAFGIHKSLDMAGSAIGIFIAYLLLKGSSGEFNYKYVFMISVIPALFSLIMFLWIKEKRADRVIKTREPFWRNLKKLDSQLKMYLIVVMIFTLGNSSNAFLLLRAKSIGFSDTSVILLYFFYNVSASLLAIPAGRLSDKVGRKRLLVTGYIVFSLVYLGFAVSASKTFLPVLFLLYGAYTAMIAGVERAFIAEVSPKDMKGTMLGLHSTVVGMMLFPASAIAGILWNIFGAAAPFVFGAVLSFIAAGILILFMNNRVKVC